MIEDQPREPSRLLLSCACFIATLLATANVRADALDRLRLDRLETVHRQVAELREQWQPVPARFPLEDVRAAIHVHSHLSHDSQAPLEEIVAAARKLGIQVLMFTEHRGAHFDYIRDGHRGLRDGVLLIPGAETGGLLVFPPHSLGDHPSSPPQTLADQVREAGGQVFLSHLEERLDWELTGLTGSEIYNTHADVKDEANFLKLLRSPLGLFNLGTAVKQYPRESFAAIQDYPHEYLARYDELCLKQPLCAIAANDSHHNQVYRLKLNDRRALVLEDALGKQLAQIPSDTPLVSALLSGREAGDVLIELDLDPYELSLGHVSTHLLVETISEAHVRRALEARRTYVAFDWMADPTTFLCWAESDTGAWPMGEQLAWQPNMRLCAAAPVSGEFRIIGGGREVHREQGRAIAWEVPEPGVYRVEVWLTLAGEPRPWILANPVYFTGP